VDEEAIELTTSVLAAAESAMPRSRGVEKQTKWWTVELSVFRSHVKRARRRLQRAGDSPEREARLLDYRRARNSYFVAVRKAKKESWEKFVTEEGNKDPWGIPYKVLADKQKKELLLSTMRFEDGYEHDVDQLAKKLLHVLLPDDSMEDTVSHAAIRDEADAIVAVQDSQDITEEEIWKALSSMGKRKAPGYDELTVEIWMKAWPVVRQKVLDLMNRCLRAGRFPSAWKIGLVRILYKGDDKDPKSFRPLTLLPVLGKLYEKVLNSRILGRLEEEGKLHSRQFGCRPGRGTEGAVMEVLDRVKASAENLVLAVFLDIAGAFDTAWWPKILVQLRDVGVQGKELEVVKDYFRDRHAILRFRGVEQEKRLTMGLWRFLARRCGSFFSIRSLDKNCPKDADFLHMPMMVCC
jgi:hypothetical protein